MEKIYRYVSGDGSRARVGRDGLPTDGQLPRGVADYIGEGGMGDGSGRNNALFKAATQLRDEGWSQEEVANRLVPVAMGAGLSQFESESCVASSFKGTKREPAMGASGRFEGGYGNSDRGAHGVRVEEQEILTPAMQKVKQSIKRAGPVAVPAPQTNGGLKEYIEALFQPGDGIGLAHASHTREGDMIVVPDQPRGYAEMIKKAEEADARGDGLPAISGEGVYVRVNPFPLRGEFEDEGEGTETSADDANEGGFVEKLRYSEDNVAEFRHTLIEWDDCPKELQLGRLIASGLPLAAIVDSGGKSLHGIVRVDAADKAEYDERVQMIHALFDGTGLDSSCKNASRLSRLPDAARKRDIDVMDKASFTDPSRITFQRLISGPVGPESWKKFEAETGAGAFGEEFTFDDLMSFDPDNDPDALFEDRWLSKGGSLMLASGAGVGKSTLLTQMVIGWANPHRRDIHLGMKPLKPLKSAVLQVENDAGDVSEAFKGAVKGFKLNDEERESVKENVSFHRIVAVTSTEFLNELESFVALRKPDVVVLDPLSAFIDGDIMDASAVKDYLYLRLASIQARTGVLVVLVHHTGKPPKAQESSVEVSPTDLMYNALGSSLIQNYCRDVLMARRIAREENETAVFALSSCKRRRKAGFMTYTDDHLANPAKPTDTIYMQHAEDGHARWLQCAKPEEPNGRGRTSRKKAQEAIAGSGEASEAERAKLLNALSPSERKYFLQVIDAAGGLSCKPTTEEFDEIAAGLQKSRSSVRRYYDTVMEAISRGGLASLSTFIADVKDAPDITLAEGIRSPREWRQEYEQRLADAAAKAVQYVDAADHK